MFSGTRSSFVDPFVEVDDADSQKQPFARNRGTVHYDATATVADEEMGGFDEEEEELTDNFHKFDHPKKCCVVCRPKSGRSFVCGTTCGLFWGGVGALIGSWFLFGAIFATDADRGNGLMGPHPAPPSLVETHIKQMQLEWEKSLSGNWGNMVEVEVQAIDQLPLSVDDNDVEPYADPWFTVFVGDGTTALINDLMPSTQYFFRLQVHNMFAHVSYWSLPIAYTTMPAAAPDASASTPFLSDSSETSLSLSWESPEDNGADLEFLELEVSDAENNTDVIQIPVVHPTDAPTPAVTQSPTNPATVMVHAQWTDDEDLDEHQVSDLQHSSDYSFRVRALNAEGVSEWSSLSTYRTDLPDAGAPEAPAQINCTGLTSSGFLLEWAPSWDNGAMILQYEVSVDITPEFPPSPPVSSAAFPGLVIVRDSFKPVGSLESNTTYFISVSATNSRGSSPFSTLLECRTYPATPPATPEPPTRRANFTDAITVSWELPDENGSPIDYILLQRDDGSGDHFVEGVNLTREDVAFDQKEFTFVGLTWGEEYAFRVRMANGAGWTDYSQAATYPTRDNDAACGGIEERAVMADGDRFNEVNEDCGWSCWSSGVSAECVSKCVREEWPQLGVRCADCMGSMINCSTGNCWTSCGINTNSPQCHECLMQNCMPNQIECTGLTFEELPPI